MAYAMVSGTMRDGTEFFALVDASYSSVPLRAGRNTLVRIQFSGTYMMESQERRTAFDDAMTAALASRSGVFVAGVTRPNESYTFLYYVASDDVTPNDIPIDEELQPIARVCVSRDPTWNEYELFVPRKRTPWERLRQLLAPLWKKPGMLMLPAPDDGDEDQAVLKGARCCRCRSRETDRTRLLSLHSHAQ